MQKFQKKLEWYRQRYRSKMENKKGFSLIEIIVYIVIVSILVAVAVTAYSRNTEDAKIARAKEDLRVLAGAAQLYDMDTGLGTSNIVGGKIEAGSTESSICKTLQGTEDKIDGNKGGPWLKTCPTPPWNGKAYEAYQHEGDNFVNIDFRVQTSNGEWIDSADLAKITK